MSTTLRIQHYVRFKGRRDSIRLNGAVPFAKGSKRFVYQMPSDPGLVLKIKRKRNFSKKVRSALRKSPNTAEAYWCRKIHNALPVCGFVPKVFGWKLTDKGMALLVERVQNWDGSPALRPTEYIRRFGRIEEVRKAIEKLITFLAEHHVVCNDISEQNILIRYGVVEIQAVIVDGFGENHLVPYPTLSKWMNRKKLCRKKQRIIQKLYMITSHGRPLLL